LEYPRLAAEGGQDARAPIPDNPNTTFTTLKISFDKQQLLTVLNVRFN
jgi:hypothetical protein